MTDNSPNEKNFAAASSVAAAVFLTLTKLLVGVMTGSLGILAEAAHSGLDLAAALITLFAVRVSDRPADESHPYGHAKVENLSALAETALLFLTCAWIIYEAYDRLFVNPKQVDPSLWAFLVMGVSIVVDTSRSRLLSRVAKKYKSQALEADALHFSTDIWSSMVVIGGLALVKLGEWTGQKEVLTRADAFAALIVAVIVILVSGKLGKRAVDVLVDRAPYGAAEQITVAARNVPLVRGVDNVRVRSVGNRNFVDLNVLVPRYLSFEESHTVSDRVEEAVRLISPNADIVVHSVPVSENEGVLERIQSVAARGHFSVHNITTHWTNRGMWIDLDLEVEPELSLERAHSHATELENQLRQEFSEKSELPEFGGIGDINVHIEPRPVELVQGTELSRADARHFANEIKTISQSLPHVLGTSDIQLQRLDGKVYLSFHLQLDGDSPISEVHGLAEEIENRLRRGFPQLGRVVIHAEPVPRRQEARRGTPAA